MVDGSKVLYFEQVSKHSLSLLLFLFSFLRCLLKCQGYIFFFVDRHFGELLISPFDRYNTHSNHFYFTCFLLIFDKSSTWGEGLQVSSDAVLALWQCYNSICKTKGNY